jgi:uncharacterized membrane protein
MLIGMDPSARYIIGAFPAGVSAAPAAVLWTAGGASVLAAPGSEPEPRAVNASGVVVGRSQRDGNSFAWWYRDGTFRELPRPAGATDTWADAINAQGDIVGVASDRSGRWQPVIWPAADRSAMRILSPDEPIAGAFALADDGTAYGTLGDGDAPVTWAPDGTMTELPVPGGGSGGKVLGVAGDWAYGWAGEAPAATGPATTGKKAPPPTQWVRWHLPSRRVDLLAGIEATGIDAQGVVIGAVSGADGSRKPARWREGSVELLPLTLRGAQQGVSFAVAVSSDGRTIISEGGLPHGPSMPVLWRC